MDLHITAYPPGQLPPSGKYTLANSVEPYMEQSQVTPVILAKASLDQQSMSSKCLLSHVTQISSLIGMWCCLGNGTLIFPLFYLL